MTRRYLLAIKKRIQALRGTSPRSFFIFIISLTIFDENEKNDSTFQFDQNNNKGKQMKNVLALLVLVTLSGFAQAQDATTTQTEKTKAGLFLEPGVTYQSQDTKVTYGAPFGDSTGKNNGLGLSLRLGMHINEMFFAGLDGRYAMTKFEDSAINDTVDAKSYDVAPVIGFQMPDIGLRFWGSYVVVGNIDPDQVTSTTPDVDAKFSEANGFRVGAGFHVYSVSLNLEYQDLKYNKVEVDAIGATFTPDEATSKGLVFGVSFPIEL